MKMTLDEMEPSGWYRSRLSLSEQSLCYLTDTPFEHIAVRTPLAGMPSSFSPSTAFIRLSSWDGSGDLGFYNEHHTIPIKECKITCLVKAH